MKANKAFTLIEIILVIIIIGVVLGMALPNFSKGYSRFVLNKTTDDLLSVSRWAQAMAIGQERAYALSFSEDQRSYKLMREDMNEESDLQDDLKPVPGALGRKHQIPQAIRLETESDNIKFYPDGTIDPSTIQLESAGQKVTLSSTQVGGMMTKVDNE